MDSEVLEMVHRMSATVRQILEMEKAYKELMKALGDLVPEMINAREATPREAAKMAVGLYRAEEAYAARSKVLVHAIAQYIGCQILENNHNHVNQVGVALTKNQNFRKP